MYILFMTTLQEQFFELIRAGLWGTPANPVLFDGQTDWKEIYRSARVQALLGVVFDGVQSLPKEKLPPRALYLQWCNVVLQMEENNRLLNRELGRVYALLRKESIEPVLMKGQGLAQNYRHPLHRQCGDIDLFTGLRDYDRANELLRIEASSDEEELYKHASFTWHGIVVENHRILTQLSAPGPNRRLQREIERWHGSADCRKRMIEAVEVTLPPLPFDTVFVLLHAIQHFLDEGIGLRQICDWACMLYAQRDMPGREETAALLKALGLEKAARVFGAIVVCYLGLPAEHLPVPFQKADIKTAEWLLSDIWAGGNFGKHNAAQPKRPRGYWRGKWHTFVRVSKRCREWGAIVPQEARWHPLALALHAVSMQWKKRVR